LKRGCDGEVFEYSIVMRVFEGRVWGRLVWKSRVGYGGLEIEGEIDG
jgi:hypothetical protein